MELETKSCVRLSGQLDQESVEFNSLLCGTFYCPPRLCGNALHHIHAYISGLRSPQPGWLNLPCVQGSRFSYPSWVILNKNIKHSNLKSC